MKKLKVVLANAPMNNGNRGCVALSISALYIIDKILSESNTDYEIYLPDGNWHDGKSHTVPIYGKILTYKDCDYPCGFTWKQSLLVLSKILSKQVHNISAIKQADYILDIGQGDSFSDIYGQWRFNSIDLIHRLARLYSIPYCMLPQTIGPFEDNHIKRKALKSITEANLCMSRDKQSTQYVLENKPGFRCIKEYIDIAFFLPYQTIKQDESYTHVGLNISALLWNGGYTGKNQFGLTCNYRQIIKDTIDYFINIPKTKLHLVPHVVLQERNIENDYEVCYDIWRKNKDLILAPYALDPIEVKSYIAGMDFFMGSRMHSTIAAFSSGVPVVPMAYSRKFNGLFVESLQYPYILDMKSMTEIDAKNKLREFFNNRYTLKNIIDDRLSKVIREKKDLVLSDLREFFSISNE